MIYEKAGTNYGRCIPRVCDLPGSELNQTGKQNHTFVTITVYQRMRGIAEPDFRGLFLHHPTRPKQLTCGC